MENEFTILIDTREKIPWNFSCITQICKLDTGDYSILGAESKLCIERKKSVSEIAGNITKQAFKNEMERMKEYQYKFLVLEFSIDDILKYPIGSNIPKKMWDKIAVGGKFIMRYLSDLQVNYGVHVIFAQDTENAEYIAYNIMKRVYEQS